MQKEIVILTHGWVVVGDVQDFWCLGATDHEVAKHHAMYGMHITNGSFIYNSEGVTELRGGILGQLALEGPRDTTILRNFGSMAVYPTSVIGRIKCNAEAWKPIS